MSPSTMSAPCFYVKSSPCSWIVKIEYLLPRTNNVGKVQSIWNEWTLVQGLAQTGGDWDLGQWDCCEHWLMGKLWKYFVNPWSLTKPLGRMIKCDYGHVLERIQLKFHNSWVHMRGPLLKCMQDPDNLPCWVSLCFFFWCLVSKTTHPSLTVWH